LVKACQIVAGAIEMKKSKRGTGNRHVKEPILAEIFGKNFYRLLSWKGGASNKITGHLTPHLIFTCTKICRRLRFEHFTLESYPWVMNMRCFTNFLDSVAYTGYRERRVVKM
jgi:hypothetical protein